MPRYDHFDAAVCFANFVHRTRYLFSSLRIEFTVVESFLVFLILPLNSLAAHVELYYLPKSFLNRLINELTEQEPNELARDTAKNDLPDISLFFRSGFTITSGSNITKNHYQTLQRLS
jgi:hypothetical protein